MTRAPGGAGAIRAGAAYVQLNLRAGGFRRALADAGRRLRNFGRAAMNVGRTMMIAGALMLVPWVSAVKVFTKFDDNMRQVGAVASATAKQLAGLREQAKLLGATTSFTAIQVSALMVEIGRAGFSTKEIDSLTESVLDLARATRTDATLSAQIMTKAIRQFGLAAKDGDRVADLLTVAANKSMTTVESLGEALKFAAPVAKSFNMSLQDTLVVIGALGNIGIPATLAGTATRRIMLAMGANTKKLEGIFHTSFTNAAGDLLPMIAILKNLDNVTSGLSNTAKAAKFQKAFGLRGITGAIGLGGKRQDIDELEKALNNVAGEANRVSREMDAGIGGAFRLMISAIETLKITIGEVLNEDLIKMMQAFRLTAVATIEWVKENKDLVKTIASVSAGVLIAGTALVGLGATLFLGGVLLSALTGGFKLLAVVMFGAAAAVLPVVGAMMLFPAAIKFLVDWVGNLGERFMAVFDKMGDIAGDTFEAIGWAISAGDIDAALEVLVAGLNLMWHEGAGELIETWHDFKTKFMSVTSTMLFEVLRQWTKFKSGVMAIWTEMEAVSAGVGERIGNFFTKEDDHIIRGRAQRVGTSGPEASDELRAIHKKFAKTRQELAATGIDPNTDLDKLEGDGFGGGLRGRVKSYMGQQDKQLRKEGKLTGTADADAASKIKLENIKKEAAAKQQAITDAENSEIAALDELEVKEREDRERQNAQGNAEREAAVADAKERMSIARQQAAIEKRAAEARRAGRRAEGNKGEPEPGFDPDRFKLGGGGIGNGVSAGFSLSALAAQIGGSGDPVVQAIEKTSAQQRRDARARNRKLKIWFKSAMGFTT